MSDNTLRTIDDGKQPTVEQCLERAVKIATEQGMSTSELLGIFYYYTHSIAESHRQDALSAASTANS